MQAVSEPVVERRLASSAIVERVPSLRFLDESLGLAPLNPGSDVVLAKTGHLLFGLRNPRAKYPSQSAGGARLLQAGQPVWKLSAAGTFLNQAPAAAIALVGRSLCVL